MTEVSAVVPREHELLPVTTTPAGKKGRLKRWLREPLLHFLILGAVLFAIYGYINRGRGGVEQSRRSS